MIADKYIGRLEALLSSMLFSLSFYFTKTSRHSAGELAIIRGISNLIISYFHSLYKREELFTTFDSQEKCNKRSIIGVVSIGMLMHSTKFLSLSVNSVVSRMNVFAVFIMGMIYQKNHFTTTPLILMIISFIGITLVVCPSVYGFKIDDSSKGLEFKGTSEEYLGLLCAVGFILANGFARVFSSSISHEVNPIQSIFSINLFLIIFYSFIIHNDPIVWSLDEVPTYIGLSITSYLFQVLNQESIRKEPNANILAIIQTSLIVFTVMIDVYIMNNSINTYNYIGILIVSATTFYAIVDEG